MTEALALKSGEATSVGLRLDLERLPGEVSVTVSANRRFQDALPIIDDAVRESFTPRFTAGGPLVADTVGLLESVQYDSS